MRKPWLLLALVGCTTEKSSWEPLIEATEAGGPSEIVIATVAGQGTVEVPIILVNELGIPVGAEGAAELRVEGATATLVSSSVTFDASGYGLAQVETDGPERFTIAVNSTTAGVGGGAEGTGYAVSGGLPGFQLDAGARLPEDIQDPDFTRSGTEGVAVARGSEVWWVPAAPGRSAWRVMALPLDTPVQGMWAAHIDGDGVLDLVVWSSAEAFALRGRAGGGYSWGAAWAPKSGTIAGITVSDLNGDRLADLAIASTGEVASGVDILDGDGAWGFESSSALELDFPIWGVSASDEGRDGRADISVLSEITGFIRRYTLSDEGWVGGTWPEIEVGALEGTTLWPALDLDENGTDDLILVGPPGSAQDLVLYTMGESVVRWQLPYGSIELSPGDMNGTAPPELCVLEPGTLDVLRSIGTASDPDFTHSNHSVTDETGPIATTDADGDGVYDVGTFTSDVRWLRGTIANDVWDTTSWSYRSYSVSISGPVLYQDFNDDGLVDLLSLEGESGAPVLKIWNFVVEDGETRPRSGDDVTLAGDTPESLAACDIDGEKVIYAITSSGSSFTLSRLRFDGDDNLNLDASTVVSGSMVVCGDFGSSEAAVVGASGSWVGYEYAGGALDTTSDGDDVGSALAVAAADTDGDGTDEVVACSDTGCSIAAADLDGDGADEVIVGGNSLTLTDDDSSTTLDGAGAVSVADVDGDGYQDVLALDTSATLSDDDESRRVLVLRGVTGGVAPALVWHTTRELYAPLGLGDVTGDGVPELVAEGSGGSVVHTSASTAGE